MSRQRLDLWMVGHGLAETREKAQALIMAGEVMLNGQKALKASRFDAITTEILNAPPFYFAEDYHQQYLAKNPMGYCGLGGTGVSCPVGVGAKAAQSARV